MTGVSPRRHAPALAPGRAAAHPARGDRTGARGHGPGGSEDAFRRCRSSPRSSAASSSRSAPTCRTTTRTHAAAPTPRTGSAPCASRRRAHAAAPVLTWYLCRVRNRRCRACTSLPWRLGAARGGRGVDPRRRALHGEAAAVRLRGLGELFVFLFFGLVAVAGSYFVQTEELRWEAVALAVPVGLLAAAILVVNNVRDMDTDRRAGKRTLAVKLGRERARRLFVAMVVVSFLVPPLLVPALSPWLLLTLAALPLAPPLVRTVMTHRRTRSQRRPGRNRAASGDLLAAPLRRSAALVKRSVLRLSVPLKEPFVTASGVITARELLLLRLEASDGTSGYGEAAPFEPYDGVPLERAVAALTGGGGRRPPQARAAEEIARLDLQAKQEDRPLADPLKDALAVNMTLPGGPPAEVAARPGGRGGRLRLLQAQGRLAGRSRRGGRRPRGGRPLARPAGGRQRRLVGRPGRTRDPRDRGARPRVRRTALPDAAGARRRCASGYPRDRRRRVGEHAARAEARRRARGLRRRERQARRLGWLPARARDPARGRGSRPGPRSCRAPSTGPGESPPRFNSPRPRGCRWPAASPPSRCSTPI